MRVAVPILLSLAVLSLAACDKEPDSKADAVQATKPGLTIKTDGSPIPVQKGKLQVLPPGPVARPVAAPAPRPAPPPLTEADDRTPPPEPPQDRVASRGDGPNDRRFDDARFDERQAPPPRDRWAERTEMPPSPRECRRAARRGEPLASSEFCREILGDSEDRALADDCLAADRAGDAFADSRACRRILGY